MIRCGTCGERFEPNLADDPQEDGWTIRHFECPHCGEDYPVARISPRGMEIIEELKEPDADRQRLVREMQGEVERWRDE